MPPRTFLSLVSVVVPAALALGLTAAPASATPGKEFTLKIAPAQVPGGATSSTITATLTNPKPANEQVGSVNLTPPPGITVTAASVKEQGRAAVVAGTVRLRDLALAPGPQQRTVTLTVDTGCGPSGPEAWTVAAKQSNDFNGTGNDLLPSAASSFSTAVAGCGRLVWTREPTNAQINTLISGTAYVATADKPQVAVVDADGTVISTATGSVALALGPREGDGALSAGAAQLAGGQAAFDVKITRSGTYSLVARVASGPYTGLTATSRSFRLSDNVQTCTLGALCTTSLTRGNAQFTVNALPFGDTPFLTLSQDPGLTLRDSDCAANWTNYGTATALFEVTSLKREKTISVTIPKDVVQINPDNGAPRIDLCFASPEPFARKVPGTSHLRFDWDLDPTTDNNTVHAGLLPDCGAAAPPCISQRKKVSGGRGYIEARLPAKTGDPAMRT